MSDRYSDLPLERLRKFGWSADDLEGLDFDGDPIINRGGPGSGHFGHEGRPGQRGGSQPGEGGGDERRYKLEDYRPAEVNTWNVANPAIRTVVEKAMHNFAAATGFETKQHAVFDTWGGFADWMLKTKSLPMELAMVAGTEGILEALKNNYGRTVAGHLRANSTGEEALFFNPDIIGRSALEFIGEHTASNWLRDELRDETSPEFARVVNHELGHGLVRGAHLKDYLRSEEAQGLYSVTPSEAYLRAVADYHYEPDEIQTEYWSDLFAAKVLMSDNFGVRTGSLPLGEQDQKALDDLLRAVPEAIRYRQFPSSPPAAAVRSVPGAERRTSIRVIPYSETLTEIVVVEDDAEFVERGGPGSGHFGHEGRPGQRGGSQPGEGGGEPRYKMEGGGHWKGTAADHKGEWAAWLESGKTSAGVRDFALYLKDAATVVELAGFSLSMKRRMAMGAHDNEFVKPSSWITKFINRASEYTDAFHPVAREADAIMAEHDRTALYRLSLDAMRYELQRQVDNGVSGEWNAYERGQAEFRLAETEKSLAEVPDTGIPSFVQEAMDKGWTGAARDLADFEALFTNPTERNIFLMGMYQAQQSRDNLTLGRGTTLLGQVERWSVLSPPMADVLRTEMLARGRPEEAEGLVWDAEAHALTFQNSGVRLDESMLASALRIDAVPWTPQDEGSRELAADVLNMGWQTSTVLPPAVMATEEAAKLWGGTPVPRNLYDTNVGTTWVYKDLVPSLEDIPTVASVPSGDKVWLNDEARVNAFYAEEGMRADIRGVLENIESRTQEWFKDAGYEPSDTVRLYRGITAPRQGMSHPPHDLAEGGRTVANWNPDRVESGPATVQMYSLSSWSLTPSTALSFGHLADGEGGYVIAADIPISRVVATASTGFPCQSEDEFIIKGNGGIDGVVITGHGTLGLTGDALRYANLAGQVRDAANNLLTQRAAKPTIFPDLVAWHWIAEHTQETDGLTPAELDAKRREEAIVTRGGPGSGHFGHEGRPGHRGGSQPGDQTGDERYKAESGKKGGKPRGAVASTPRASTAAGTRYFGKASDDIEVRPAEHGALVADWFANKAPDITPESDIGKALSEMREATTPDELSKGVEALERAMMESARPGTPTRLRYIMEPEVQEAWKAVNAYRQWQFFNAPETVREAFGGWHPAEGNKWAFRRGISEEAAMDFQYSVGSAMLDIANLTGVRVTGLSVRDHIPPSWVKELQERGKDPAGLRGGFDPRHGELVLPPEAYSYVPEREATILHELTHVVDDAAAGVEGHSPFADGIYASTVLEVPSLFAERIVSTSDIYERHSDVTGEFIADSVAGLHLNMTTGIRTGQIGITAESGVRDALLQWLKAVNDGSLEGLPVSRGRLLASEGNEPWHQVERAMTDRDGTRIFIRTLDDKGGYEMLFKPDGPFAGPEPVERGGPGSGHFGHAGRPGQRGGSAPGEGGGGEQGGKRYSMAGEPKRYLSYHGDTKDSPKVKAMASELYGRSTASEPRLSAVMETMLAASGGKAFGWDFRQKSERSIAEKIVRDAFEKDIPLEQAASEMNDLNRYTVMFPPDTFVEQVLQAQTTLQQAGFVPYDAKAKNYFAPGDDYDGYNTVYWDPKSGERFELQFHTEETASIKEEAHLIYNAWRELPTDHPERLDMWGRMVALWQNYSRPKNYERLPGRLMASGGAG